MMPDPEYTCHSEYLPLQSVILQPANAIFSTPEKIASQWKALNYLSEPEKEKVLAQYAHFESLLKTEVPRLLPMTGTPELPLDAVYCRDASIATDFGMIPCRMGKEARMPEPDSHMAFYASQDIPLLGRIESPGTLEGGDVAWLDSKTLAVGRSYRTNDAGIEQLKALLEPRGIEVITVDLPHYKGPSDVFHLMSILSPVDRDLAVAYSPLMPIAFRKELLARGFGLIEVTDAEFESLGSNVLAIAPRNCIMTAGNPLTARALQEAGCIVHSYPGSDISLKGGGGPTCLTRPYQRLSNPTS